MNQFNESFWVLKWGGYAGFSVWGWKENSGFFTIFPELFAKYGLTTGIATARSHFHLGDEKHL